MVASNVDGPLSDVVGNKKKIEVGPRENIWEFSVTSRANERGREAHI